MEQAVGQNLLFAILAVHNDLVSRDAMISAVEGWASDRSVPIGRHLVDQGRLDSDDAVAIDGMVDRLIRKSGGDTRTALSRLSSVSDLAGSLTDFVGNFEIEVSPSEAGATFREGGSLYGHEPGESAAGKPGTELGSTIAGCSIDGGSDRMGPDDSANPGGTRIIADGEASVNRIAPAAEPVPGQRLGRFRIVRKLNKGGQGVVFEATDDTELNRRVALKITREENRFAVDQIREGRARLAREGRINALLEHPNIIPVYGLGVTAEGRPYYAMRFLDQIELQTAIGNFHAGLPLMHKPQPNSESPSPGDGPIARPPDQAAKAARQDRKLHELADPLNSRNRAGHVDPRSPSENGSNDSPPSDGWLRLNRLEGERNLAFRNLLERFTDVCDAIDYAHSRGVLHRDLKPVNVMLGEHGETLVIDWGMARSLDEIRSEPERNGQGSDQNDLLFEVDEDYRISKQGEFKGTLGHAAPEQLAGDVDSLDARTDVYALGVVLFEILTGRQPFPREELRFVERREWRATMLAWAMDGAPDPIEANPTVPRPLAAICRKALAPAQADRYGSAAELAEEVENWLADEPVRAWQETRRERLARWARKNRGKSAAFVASVALASLASVAGLLMQASYTREILAERDRAQASEEAEKQQREEAEKQRAEADKQRAEAIANQTTSEYTTRFMVNLFESADPIGMDGLVFRNHTKQSELTVKEVLNRGAEKVDTEFRDRPEIRARILRAIGQSFREISEFGQAEKYLTENLAIVESRAGTDPATLSDAYLQLARLYHYWAKYDSAEPFYSKAEAAIGSASGEGSEESRAKLLFFVGWFYADQIDTVKAESYFGRALEIYDRLLKLRPNDPQLFRDKSILKLGIAACKFDSERVVEGVLEIMTVLPLLASKTTDRNMKAVTHFQLGLGASYYKRFERAETQFETALQYAATGLGLDHPYAAFVFYHLALAQEEQGKFGSAQINFEKCLELARKTVSFSHPRVVFLVRSYAAFLERRGKSEQALAILDEMIDERVRDDGSDSFRVADAYAAKAYHLYDFEKDLEGDDALSKAVEIYDRKPGKWSFIIDDVYESWADKLTDRGRYAEAIEYYDKIIDLISPRSQPATVARIRAEKWEVVSNFARSLAIVPGRDPADYARAVDLARKACESKPGDGDFRSNLGLVLYRAGKYSEAAATLESSLEINRVARKGVERPTDLAFLAMSCWRLGRHAEAEAIYARLVETMRRKEFATSRNSRQFLREATNLIFPMRLPDDPFGP